MPDIVRLRYVGSAPVSVPAIGREVEPDCIVDFAGRVLDAAEDADHYLIESGTPAQARAWPKTLWRNETVTAKKSKE